MIIIIIIMIITKVTITIAQSLPEFPRDRCAGAHLQISSVCRVD